MNSEQRVMNRAKFPSHLLRAAAAESTEDEGPSSHSQSRRAIPPRGAKNRILLADDDPSVQSLLTRALESEGFEVIQARTGREAVSKLLGWQPDLVLLDLKMPDKDGWEAYELMERLHPLSPVIVITALPNQLQRAVSLGVDALMEKPLELPVLIRAIRGLLAEPEADRIARLTRGDFATVDLGSSSGTT